MNIKILFPVLLQLAVAITSEYFECIIFNYSTIYLMHFFRPVTISVYAAVIKYIRDSTPCVLLLCS